MFKLFYQENIQVLLHSFDAGFNLLDYNNNKSNTNIK